MIKKILILIIATNILYSKSFRDIQLEEMMKKGYEIINYDTMSSDIKDYIKYNNDTINRNNTDMLRTIESKYILGKSKTSGYRYIENINGNAKEYDFWLFPNIILSKNNKYYGFKLGFNKKFLSEGNEGNLGLYIGYGYSDINLFNNKGKSNKVSIGIYGDYHLNDINSIIIIMNEYSYNNLAYNKYYKIDLNSINGLIKLDTKFDINLTNKIKDINAIYFSPNIKGYYNYNFKNNIKDEKEINWESKGSINGGINAGIKLGYNIKHEDLLYNIFIFTNIDKRIHNIGKYFMNKKYIDMKEDDYIEGNFGIGSDIVYKDDYRFYANGSFNIKNKDDYNYNIIIGYEMKF